MDYRDRQSRYDLQRSVACSALKCLAASRREPHGPSHNDTMNRCNDARKRDVERADEERADTVAHAPGATGPTYRYG